MAEFTAPLFVRFRIGNAVRAVTTRGVVQIDPRAAMFLDVHKVAGGYVGIFYPESHAHLEFGPVVANQRGPLGLATVYPLDSNGDPLQTDVGRLCLAADDLELSKLDTPEQCPRKSVLQKPEAIKQFILGE